MLIVQFYNQNRQPFHSNEGVLVLWSRVALGLNMDDTGVVLLFLASSSADSISFSLRES
jgi:hypothetical protein